MFKSIKKMITLKSSRTREEDDYDNPVTSFGMGAKKVSRLLVNYFSSIVTDIKSYKGKSKNLLNTNIQLGLKHLNNDRVGDAIIRFRIISFFWPSHVKTYYYLSHCYLLKKDYSKSKKYLAILLQMDPSYRDRVGAMIKKIDDGAADDL